MTYEEWMEKVDELFLETFGLTSSDFEDYMWIAAYEDDLLTPKEAFEQFCEEYGL
jgi:hypothetical protein